MKIISVFFLPFFVIACSSTVNNPKPENKVSEINENKDASMEEDKQYAAMRESMVNNQIVARGVRDPAVIQAIKGTKGRLLVTRCSGTSTSLPASSAGWICTKTHAKRSDENRERAARGQ